MNAAEKITEKILPWPFSDMAIMSFYFVLILLFIIPCVFMIIWRVIYAVFETIKKKVHSKRQRRGVV